MDIAKRLHRFPVDPLSDSRWNITQNCSAQFCCDKPQSGKLVKKINVTRSILCHRRCFALINGHRWASAQMMNDKRAPMDFIVFIHVNRNRTLSRVGFMFFFPGHIQLSTQFICSIKNKNTRWFFWNSASLSSGSINALNCQLNCVVWQQQWKGTHRSRERLLCETKRTRIQSSSSSSHSSPAAAAQLIRETTVVLWRNSRFRDIKINVEKRFFFPPTYTKAHNLDNDSILTETSKWIVLKLML